MSTQCIPANPDISGIGVRAAIYAQNLLCFSPVVAHLRDGKVSSAELDGIQDQSIGMLAIAFAILISSIIQATGRSISSGQGLTSFHAAVILDLSWMNNTSTWIWFLLYAHRLTRPSAEEKGRKPVSATWSAWIKELWFPLRLLVIDNPETSAEKRRTGPGGASNIPIPLLGLARTNPSVLPSSTSFCLSMLNSRSMIISTNNLAERINGAFGQVLSLLLLVIPIRDFVTSILDVREKFKRDNESRENIQREFYRHLQEAVRDDTFDAHDFRDLIKRGANPNMKLDDHYRFATLLEFVAWKGDADLVKDMVEWGGATDKGGRAFRAAAGKGQIAIAQILAEWRHEADMRGFSVSEPDM
ncbi:hypothetical protein B0H14DRAFT_3132195 [Mycena olivaceomarginata]|nr:hypothetical protein B0H14DRAFT_3132195 [Mycena olivaceomarginata]